MAMTKARRYRGSLRVFAIGIRIAGDVSDEGRIEDCVVPTRWQKLRKEIETFARKSLARCEVCEEGGWWMEKLERRPAIYRGFI